MSQHERLTISPDETQGGIALQDGFSAVTIERTRPVVEQTNGLVESIFEDVRRRRKTSTATRIF